jgi:hypothetical protein
MGGERNFIAGWRARVSVCYWLGAYQDCGRCCMALVAANAKERRNNSNQSQNWRYQHHKASTLSAAASILTP